MYSTLRTVDASQFIGKAPSIDEVHMEAGGGSVSGGRMWAGEGASPCERPHTKLKPIDVILSSSHAKKMTFFYQNFIFGQKKRNFSSI